MGADKLYVNGSIFTADTDRKWVEAVAVEGNKIVYAGDRAEAEKLCDSGTRICDLQGKMMLPGFIDGHCHPVMAGHVLSQIVMDVDWSIDECLDAVRKYIAENPDMDSYFGLGYSELLFDDKGPRKEMLDEICSDKPVFLMGSGAHEAWVNSKCFEIAGITKDTPDPLPGLHYFSRDEEGNPAGHVVDGKAEQMIMTKIDFFDQEKVVNLIEKNSADYAAMGVTSTGDMGIFTYMEKPYFEVLDIVRERDRYVQRFVGCTCFVEDADEADERIDIVVNAREKYDDDRYRINFLKVLNDGTMESRSAALSIPYVEDGSMGVALMDEDTAERIGLRAAKLGLDINMHAIGDVAVKSLVRVAKVLRAAGYDDTRLTCSHSEYIAEEDIENFGRYDIVANSTGVWFYGNPDMNNIIGDVADQTFRMRSLIDGGARMGLGSDFPVDEYGREPLKSIEMCATRKMYGQPDGHVLQPADEVTTVEEAIIGFTANNAYALHIDDITGTIEAGKYADMVILEKNIMEIPLEDIHKVRVCETIFDGQTTYKA